MNSYRILIPVGLGLFAAVANFLVLRAATAPIEVIVLAAEVKRGEVLTPDHFERVSMQADPQLVQAAVPWEKRGVLVGRRANRPLKKGEMLFYRDAAQDPGDDVRANLQPGETSFTVKVVTERVAPNLRPGDQVGFLVRGVPRATVVGPFRLLSAGEPMSEMGSDRERQVVVAVPAKGGQLDEKGAALEKAIGKDSMRSVLRVERYRAEK